MFGGNSYVKIVAFIGWPREPPRSHETLGRARALGRAVRAPVPVCPLSVGFPGDVAYVGDDALLAEREPGEAVPQRVPDPEQHRTARHVVRGAYGDLGLHRPQPSGLRRLPSFESVEFREVAAGVRLREFEERR